MLLIDIVQLLKLVILVGFPHHGTVTADGLLARDAEVVYLGPRMRRAILMLPLGHLLLLALKVLNQVLEEATIDELTSLKGRPAVGTLLPSLLYPFLEAISAGQLGAGRTHDCILDHAIAYEAHE